DYRYFPEPDLGPVVVTEEMLVEIQSSLPELAIARRRRFVEQYQLPVYDATVLTETRELGDYFEAVVAALPTKDPARYKGASNIIMTDVLRVVTEQKLEMENFPIAPDRLAQLVELFASDTISSKNVKDI